MSDKGDKLWARIWAAVFSLILLGGALSAIAFASKRAALFVAFVVLSTWALIAVDLRSINRNHKYVHSKRPE